MRTPSKGTKVPTAGVRGRPQILNDQRILDAVVREFARLGYEAVSMRTLSRDLGLSHSLLGQRFGSKENLYETAVSAEFERFLAELRRQRSAWPEQLSDLEELRALLHTFLSAAAAFPALCQLMNQEGSEPSSRLWFIAETVVRPQVVQLADILQRLISQKIVRPVSTRALFFLVAHGAAAPFTLTALSSVFNEMDGPLTINDHVETMTELIFQSLIVGTNTSLTPLT